MDVNTAGPTHEDRTAWLRAMGVLLLLAGTAFGLLAPVEMHCFRLFSEGGRFHYEGFGFGSFMFGNIAGQIVGYYLIAAVLIPLGYGHLKLRRWMRPLMLALLWAWLVVGAPLTAVVGFILMASKDLSPPGAAMALAGLALAYLLLPALLIWFYRGRNVRCTLEAGDPRSHRIEDLPTPILVLSCLYAFYIVVLHLLILFNGIFPMFGAFRFGLQGTIWLDITIAGLVCIAWGTLQRRRWAWWGSVILLGLFTFSTILTLWSTSYSSLLAGLAFPPREMEMLGGIPAQGWHLAILFGMPLLITWCVVLSCRRCFRPGDRERRPSHVSCVN